MNIHLINYATPEYYRSQRLSNESAHSMGGVDRITAYHTSDIDADFYRRNRRILNHPRGGGYWLWKPYFIQRTLAGMKEGDYLFYCDATALFLQPIQLLVDLARTQSLDVLVFDSRFPEWKFSKRDALVLMDCDHAEHTHSLQRMATFSLWRKTPTAMAIADEFLHFSEDERIITDLPNTLGKPDHPGFRENRHDQTVLSLVSKRHGLPGFRPLHQVGNGLVDEYPNSPYPQMINLTRKSHDSIAMRIVRRYERALRWIKSGGTLEAVKCPYAGRSTRRREAKRDIS